MLTMTQITIIYPLTNKVLKNNYIYNKRGKNV